jgi:hypothetical protein
MPVSIISDVSPPLLIPGLPGKEEKEGVHLRVRNRKNGQRGGETNMVGISRNGRKDTGVREKIKRSATHQTKIVSTPKSMVKLVFSLSERYT